MRCQPLRRALCIKGIMKSTKEKIIKHYAEFFEGHDFEILSWELGPIKKIVPDFQVVRFAPGPQINMWVYCSVGASEITHSDSVLHEFVVVSPIESNRLVEMLAMVTYYHSNHNLGFGHTLPIGEPWLEGSNCENWLISLPYPFGEDLEIMPLNSSHVHVAWLLPITDDERNFKIKYDLDALEQKFDDAELKYWEVKRSSVV
ncbi:suppressor of fused domain protein [Vibrio mimicus]|nr:suppressor of fused domain protein [Vibrio cholerae]ELN3183664.1 suppressor of fused domain protein [Vibrio cholerae]MBP0925412.1 suppressor of fused domain protein [Vibrio cholerae]HDZ9160764.1 suppressor of fused domain protein [Vibrio cholerae]